MRQKDLLKKLAKAELLRQAQSNDGKSKPVDSEFLAPGPEYEELTCDLRGQELPAKLIAYYLPQFYPFPENDEWWGKGFTEWNNVTKARPRFQGHYQPHLPSDLGYYDLRNTDVMRQQADIAQKAGIHAWCFYYYRFGDKRLLEVPVNNFLDTPDIEMPFCLMWANQGWNRGWTGGDKEVLIEQNYDPAHDEEFIDDLAKHFNDPRYLKLDGKPLFYIYNPSEIPDSKNRIAKWKELLKSRHHLDVTMHMVQYRSKDPRRLGLDGAIEFPPHKVNNGVEVFNQSNSKELPNLEKTFTGNFARYTDLANNSIKEKAPEYDMVKCIVPSWDNIARRPNKGLGFIGSSPQKYQDWLQKLIQYAKQNPVQGEAIVAINAWNEWAEGAHLEPDVYYGSAYLNATARALLASK